MVAKTQAARAGSAKPRRGNFSRSPLLVFYEITQACDLVCNHCRACAQTNPRPDELSADESLRLIYQLSDFPSPPMLVLTGGDPLKRADIFSLIRHAVSRGLDVSITPSATPLVTTEAIRQLRDAGISRLAVSIDGADAPTHDATRGVQGSFERTLKVLEQAGAEGIATQVNTTLTPGNVHQIDRMCQLLTPRGIVLWSVFFLIPTGRAKFAPRLSATECESAFATLWRQSRLQPYRIKTTEAPHYRRYIVQQQAARRKVDREVQRWTAGTPLGVNDGNGVMFIGHNGEIYPSGFMPLCCGRFPNDNVVRVYQDSKIFRALRDSSNLQGKCHACEFRNICGGSRARAYAVTGSAFAEEPDCSYIPPEFANT
ncbi:MAG TPA: TIGR04053 family radical SAM/SPASM domain-containing protein [Lacipirellulaceae bacterium]|nr:TIGR04053 family radical SAM/SPASM domain-containing protein [Lacipirellulaceae bacterium]